jgi:hypothetical protein
MKIYLGLLLASCASAAQAGNINCSSTITNIINYPVHCEGNYAFRTTKSQGVWMCAPSEKGDALLLTAYTTKKELKVYLDDKNGTVTCATMPRHEKVSYIYI